MSIDEEKVLYDLSDHCLVDACFRMENTERGHQYEYSTVEYYKTNCVKLKNYFLSSVSYELVKTKDEGQQIDIMKLEAIVKSKAENTIKYRFNKRVSIGDKSGKLSEPIWMNEQIKQKIKIRRQLNRAKRNTNNEEKVF